MANASSPKDEYDDSEEGIPFDEESDWDEDEDDYWADDRDIDDTLNSFQSRKSIKSTDNDY